MKEKPTGKTSINDLLNEYKVTDPVESQKERVVSQIKESNYNLDLFESIERYNSNIMNLDSLYSELQPINDVLLRVFLLVPEKTANGLVVPFKKFVPIPTKAGVGSWAEVESPFPYSTKAIVVSAPIENKYFKAGQIVQLANDQVEAQVVGSGEDAYIRIKNGFMHPDSNLTIAPKDPNNIHYGYLLVPSYEIKTIIKNV